MDNYSSLMDDAELIYVTDGTLEGLLTGIFTAYEQHEQPANIIEGTSLQESMLCSYLPLATRTDYATRVKDGIIAQLGTNFYDDVKRVFLCDDARKGGVIYRYIRYALKNGRSSSAHLAQEVVADFAELKRIVNHEAHYMMQFLRFAQLENGVFYAHIKPKCSVVPLITNFFARRLNVQPFIIYDSIHNLASVFDTNKWWLVDAQEITLPQESEIEGDFKALWQTFFDTIAIEERRNPTCQRNFMPKRFWGEMCEHIPPELRKKNPQTKTPTHVARELAASKQKLLSTAPAPQPLP